MKEILSDRIRTLFDHYVQQVRSGAQPDRAVTLASAPPEARAELERWIEDFHTLTETGSTRSVSLVAGAQIGEFRLIRELGRGGSGTVWEAEQVPLKRIVALKLLHPQYQFSPRELERFKREALAGGRLAHPGIVQVFAIGAEGGVPFIAQELIVGGRTVAQEIAALRGMRELPVGYYRSVAASYLEMARALAEVHAAGIIHRDIKPGNVLLTADGRPKIADFGLAKAEEDVSISMTGEVLGTWNYMSPEQAMAKRATVDHRTDIYSLGATLYESLTLAPAVLGDTTQQVVQKIMLEDPVNPRRIRSRVPRDLSVIAMKCLEKRPDRRYPTMQELAADLERYLKNEPIRAKPPGAVRRASKWCRRHPVVSATVAVGATCLAVITGLLLQISAEQVRTEDALAKEKERAEELDMVAEFQAEQLGAIDTQAMGWGIRTAIFEKAHEAGVRVRQTEEAMEQNRESLEKAIAGADFTNLALGVMDEHFFKSAREGIKRFDYQPLVKARLLTALGVVQRKVGLIQPARDALEEAQALYQQYLEPNDLRLLDCQEHLGVLLGEFNDPRGIAMLSSVLGARRQILGSDHEMTLTSIHTLGDVLQQMGRYEEAEPYYREALDGSRRVLGSDDQNTLATISNMGQLLVAMGKYEEAELYYREALDGSRRVLGSNHQNTLATISSMGLFLAGIGKYAEAEPYYRESLDGFRSVLGSDHPNTLATISNMGGLLVLMGKYSEAEPYYRESLDGMRRVLGSGHRDTLSSIYNMGSLLQYMDKHEEAEPYYRESLDGTRRLMGPDHPDTFLSILGLADYYSSMGKYEEAEQYYRESLEGLRRVRGSDHIDTLTCIDNMGVNFYYMEKYTEAETYHREALVGRQRALGALHDSTIGSLHNLIMVVARDPARKTEAVGLLQSALKEIPEDSSHRATLQKRLDELLAPPQ